MPESVFGEGFDLEAYVDKRLMEIEELRDRKLYKDVVGGVLLELFHYTQQEYQALEERVFGELKTGRSDCTIYTSIVDRAHYDATDSFMTPMLTGDIEKKELFIAGLQKAVQENRPYKLYTVFLEDVYERVHQFGKCKRTYHGTIQTDKGEYPGVFSIVENEDYLKMVEELYHIFGANYLSWTSVCSGYLHKLFDVLLVSAPDVGAEETVEEIKIDFEEYASNLRFDMVPLWNLSLISEKTSTYPEPCMDGTNYEHRIFGHKLDPACRYLITNTEVEVTNIRRSEGDLIITCPVKNPCEWKLYRVNRRPEKLRYPYPLLSNSGSGGFAGDLVDTYRRSVKTRAEIARLIESFDYGDYVVFQGVNLMVDDGVPPQTYDMDPFVTDELRTESAGSRQVLELNFTARNPENILTIDVMSFLVTQVQGLFPEYDCRGKLIAEVTS